jgi:hypothetical protein
MQTISETAQRYFDAAAAHDLDALVDSFSPDALILDVDRPIEGASAIRRWARNEVLGGEYEILESEPHEHGVTLILRFTPPGEVVGFRARYELEFADNRIARAELQYA